MADNELKINARGLSNPGPRMMVKSVIEGQDCKRLRVVVDSTEAVKNLEEYFESIGATSEIDEIGDEFHIMVSLAD
jgi:TusA-related sulfurtransferase